MVLGYKYVLKKMAEMDQRGSISFNALAAGMNMNTRQLRGMLEVMENMGHVSKIGDNNASPELLSCGTCKSCGCCNSGISYGTTYQLTDKGRRVCST
ncbi:FeoC-like transcriptional regulator [Methanohalophilus profundi]|uniref:FeoC-like transcriptional regulator n=1 Tax=Methanohalophilus profundi TaxID=2138083 RepID=UPI00101D7A73|nr:FeoC-like transcriptional regulator [Methanohalophilus profundi]